MEHQKEHHNKNKGLSKSFYTKIYLLLGIVLIFFALYNMSQVSSFKALYEQKLIEAKENAKPALIEMVTITTNCKDCYDINKVIEVVESTGVNITSRKEVSFSSKEGNDLVKKYGIEKVPTVILTGEISKSKDLEFMFKDIGEERQGAYVFTEPEPPFVDASTRKVRGKISLIRLKNFKCEKCHNLTLFFSQLLETGIIVEDYKQVDTNSAEGKELVSKYKIKKVPTIIMDKEAEVYPIIVEGWDKLGSVESDGSYVMREISLPYYDIEKKEIVGLVSMTILADKTCTECYDPDEFHKPVLQKMGVVFGEEKKVDISDAEGILLIDKYNIEKVPTILLTGDTGEYVALTRAWEPVGTVETDGTYVFRLVEVARQPYKDLTTGKIVS